MFGGGIIPMPKRKRQQSDPKTPAETPLRKPAHGNGLLRVCGTNKGGTGRPPDAFRARMRELATYADQQGHIESVLSDPDHAQWMAALRHVTEHGYGKPAQSVEVSGNLELERQAFVIGGQRITF